MRHTPYLLTALCTSLAAYYPLNPAFAVESRDINTATITASSASPSCADYKVVGICYWLFCTSFGCSVRTSIKVHHFIPEMVVSAYNHENQSPWTEMKWLNQGNSGGQGQILGQDKKQGPNQYTDLTFKNAEAIGHPGGLFLSMISSMGYSCESQTTAYQPYFLSALDYLAWNNHIPETVYPEAMIPGMRELGSQASTDMWSPIYPRSGWVTQVHDYKAAATIAQRVADIVSRSGQLHVYIPAVRTQSDGYWPPGEVKEGDAKTHKWQMLSPKMENTCAIFPDGEASSTYSDKISNQQNYSWTLWRPYTCCKRRGQTFLGSVDFMSY